MSVWSELIVWGWVIFWLYWVISAIGTKKNTDSIRKNFIAVRLGLFVLVVVSLRFSSHVSVNIFDNHPTGNDKIIRTAGMILFLLGLFIALWARKHLGKNWGMPMTQKQDPELVTSGPYRFVRHPIYSGILLAVLGSALVTNILWFILVLLLQGAYFIYSATVEEKIMLHEFPKVYPAYMEKTKMLIPFVL